MKYFLLANALSLTSALLLTAAAKPVPEGVVSLDVYGQQDTVDVAFVEKTVEATTFWHQRSTDGGKTWGDKHAISTGSYGIKTYTRIADAQIAASGERLIVAWTSQMPNGSAGPLRTATSADAGKTWTLGTNPADDKSLSAHEFVDLAIGKDQAVHAVWLDSRSGKQGVYSASSKDWGQSWDANQTVDAASCECCWNRIYAEDDGIFAVYRDDAPRDMVLMRHGIDKEPWTRLGVIAPFGWKATHCPEAGAGLARSQDKLWHAMTWTGKEGATGVYYSRAKSTAGDGWAEPQLFDKKGRHVDLAANGSSLFAAWDREGKSRVIVTRTSQDGGKTWGTSSVVSSPTVKAAQPRLVPVSTGFLLLWTERKAGHSAELVRKRMP